MGALDKCCFCIDLRVGCLIIGYLSLVGEIIALFLVGLLVLTGLAVTAVANDKESHIEVQSGVAILVISVIFLLFLALFLAFTIVLLVGIHQNKRGHVKAYLVYNVIFLVVMLLGIIVTLCTSDFQIGSFISNLISFLLNVYFLFVIRSYYKKMGQTPRGAALYNAA